MMYGIPVSDINKMSLEEVEMFSEFEALWREQNNIAIANAVGKALGGKK